MSNDVDISVDPGLNATGVTVFQKGQIVKGYPITLRPPKTCVTFEDKFLWLKRRFAELCATYVTDSQAIGRIAIEEFEAYNAKVDKRAFNKAAMIKCASIQGMLLAVADDFAEKAFLISKRKVSKADTAQLAKFLGVKGSKDALDSLQIGFCAGFDRKRGNT